MSYDTDEHGNMIDSQHERPRTRSLLNPLALVGASMIGVRGDDGMGDAIPAHMNTVVVDSVTANPIVGDNLTPHHGGIRPNTIRDTKDRSPGVGGKVGGSFKRRKRT